MKIIGICGSSGCGKSSVCRIFRDFGAVWLDCDAIYHDLISSDSPCLRQLKEEFGESVIRNGALDRSVLREIVFQDEEKLKRLNSISHHHVLLHLKDLIQEARDFGSKLCLIDAPMFFEANLQNWCDFVIAVVCEEAIQIQRVCKRDSITEEQARNRLRHQIPNDVLISRSDFVIENNGDVLRLSLCCKKIYERIISERNLL